MDRTGLITRHPFRVKVFANGQDISASLPLVSVRYHADGSGTRTLRDGRSVAGRWRFVDEAQNQVEVDGPEGVSRWVITELGEHRYRKTNIATGMEFVHEALPG